VSMTYEVLNDMSNLSVTECYRWKEDANIIHMCSNWKLILAMCNEVKYM
jgi:hypothetical protein